MSDEKKESARYDLVGLTERQMQALSEACDLYSRLAMGQLDDLKHVLPLAKFDEIDWSGFHEDMAKVEALLRTHYSHELRAPNSFFGIASEQVSEQAKAACDLHQVVRHRLAWDRAYDEGVIKPGDSRKWPEMMQVSFDDPMGHAKDDLPTVKRQE